MSKILVCKVENSESRSHTISNRLRSACSPFYLVIKSYTTCLHRARERPFFTRCSINAENCDLRLDLGQLYLAISVALLRNPDNLRFHDPALVTSRIFHGWSGCLYCMVRLFASTSTPNSSFVPTSSSSTGS